MTDAEIVAGLEIMFARGDASEYDRERLRAAIERLTPKQIEDSGHVTGCPADSGGACRCGKDE